MREKLIITIGEWALVHDMKVTIKAIKVHRHLSPHGLRLRKHLELDDQKVPP
jgi:hypothetical protein